MPISEFQIEFRSYWKVDFIKESDEYYAMLPDWDAYNASCKFMQKLLHTYCRIKQAI